MMLFILCVADNQLVTFALSLSRQEPCFQLPAFRKDNKWKACAIQAQMFAISLGCSRAGDYPWLSKTCSRPRCSSHAVIWHDLALFIVKTTCIMFIWNSIFERSLESLLLPFWSCQARTYRAWTATFQSGNLRKKTSVGLCDFLRTTSAVQTETTWNKALQTATWKCFAMKQPVWQLPRHGVATRKTQYRLSRRSWHRWASWRKMDIEMFSCPCNKIWNVLWKGDVKEAFWQCVVLFYSLLLLIALISFCGDNPDDEVKWFWTEEGSDHWNLCRAKVCSGARCLPRVVWCRGRWGLVDAVVEPWERSEDVDSKLIQIDSSEKKKSIILYI